MRRHCSSPHMCRMAGPAPTIAVMLGCMLTIVLLTIACCCGFKSATVSGFESARSMPPQFVVDALRGIACLTSVHMTSNLALASS